MTGNPKVGTDSLRELDAEHRECGKPKFDGCFSHPPLPHCRADGAPWPCDVHEIRLPALLDLWDAAFIQDSERWHCLICDEWDGNHSENVRGFRGTCPVAVLENPR